MEVKIIADGDFVPSKHNIVLLEHSTFSSGMFIRYMKSEGIPLSRRPDKEVRWKESRKMKSIPSGIIN